LSVSCFFSHYCKGLDFIFVWINEIIAMQKKREDVHSPESSD